MMNGSVVWQLLQRMSRRSSNTPENSQVFQVLLLVSRLFKAAEHLSECFVEDSVGIVIAIIDSLADCCQFVVSEGLKLSGRQFGLLEVRQRFDDRDRC